MPTKDETRMSVNALLLYDQADEEGIVVTTSRQAIHDIVDALIEREAELIYLRKYGRDGAVWSANDSKDIWREAARAELDLPTKR